MEKMCSCDAALEEEATKSEDGKNALGGNDEYIANRTVAQKRDYVTPSNGTCAQNLAVAANDAAVWTDKVPDGTKNALEQGVRLHRNEDSGDAHTTIQVNHDVVHRVHRHTFEHAIVSGLFSPATSLEDTRRKTLEEIVRRRISHLQSSRKDQLILFRCEARRSNWIHDLRAICCTTYRLLRGATTASSWTWRRMRHLKIDCY
jgi:hypothetical protein